MPTITCANLIAKLRPILLDPSPGVTWLDARLVTVLSQAQRKVCEIRPEAYQTTDALALVAGREQTLPAGSTQLFDVLNNTVSGRPCIPVARDLLDAAERFRPVQAAQEDVENWTYDSRSPLTFRVSPTNDGTGEVVVRRGLFPAEHASADEVIRLEDIYENPIFHFALSLCFGEETQRKDVTKSDFHDKAARGALAGRAQAQGSMAPTHASPAGECLMPYTAITDVLAPVAEITRNCPTMTMVQAYRDAARELCKVARLRELEQKPFTVAGERLVTLTDNDDEEVIGVYACSITRAPGDIKPMDEANSGSWHRGEGRDVPKYYQFVMPNYLAVEPLPNAAYELIVTKVMQPKRTATRLDTTLLQRWDECLEAGALHRLLRIPGEKWTDKDMAVNYYEPKFNGLVRSAALQHSRRDNPGAAITDDLGRPNALPRSRVLPI